MVDVTFSELIDVAPRLAWPREAREFTPWLAANLDRLGRALGMALELEQTEAAVGPFAADILARDSRDGATVLIENQLERSDNPHLGQIMTYLTGLNAKTVVWVAPEFREEHLSAVRWLNENTIEPFAFFAVKLRVVKIADSPLAPLFEVLERPNDWDRQLQRVKAEAEAAKPDTLLRRAFWEQHVQQFPDAAQDLPGSPTSRWRAIPELGLVVSQWRANDELGVFIRGGRGVDGQVVAKRLQPHEAALHEALGAPLGDPKFPFLKRLVSSLSDNTQWNTASRWLHSETERYVAGLRSVLEGAA